MSISSIEESATELEKKVLGDIQEEAAKATTKATKLEEISIDEINRLAREVLKEQENSKPFIEKFNYNASVFFSKIIGNMWACWLSILFVIALRVLFPPSPQELLLDLENDLALIFLVVLTVTGNRQQAYAEKLMEASNARQETLEELLEASNARQETLEKILDKVESIVEHIEEEEETIIKQDPLNLESFQDVYKQLASLKGTTTPVTEASSIIIKPNVTEVVAPVITVDADTVVTPTTPATDMTGDKNAVS